MSTEPVTQVYGAVAVHDDGRRRHLARLPAVAHRSAPATHCRRRTRLTQGRAVVRVVLHRLFHFPDAEARVGDAVGHPVAFLRNVLYPQLHRVHVQRFGKFVDDRLDREGALGLAGGPVSLHLLLVHHHVVPVDEQVLDVVGPRGAQRAAAHRRAGESAGFKGHPGLGSL